MMFQYAPWALLLSDNCPCILPFNRIHIAIPLWATWARMHILSTLLPWYYFVRWDVMSEKKMIT